MTYLENLFSLEGRNVIITGGAGVIAGSMAEALIKAGAKVCLWGRGTHHPGAEAVGKIGRTTGRPERVSGVTVDVGQEADIVRALGETEKVMGKPNVLINGAGGNKGKAPFVDLDLAVFREVMEMNIVAGLVIPTKFVARYWIDNKIKGAIINLTSMSSYVPLSGVWAYDAAKSAVLNLTMATAKEFASYGIRVNAIAPGFFVGHQNRALLYKNEATGELTERGKSIIDHTPFGRFGKHDELAGATVFLCSDAAAGFITGVSLAVDGGYLVHNV
jgi:NAD(P)-dependent dehydrogenase (short-subunit alcohol dehydrogenase family)